MANRQKERRVKKSVRFDADTLVLIEKKAKKSGVAFSETVRRAVTKSLDKRKKAKEK